MSCFHVAIMVWFPVNTHWVTWSHQAHVSGCVIVSTSFHWCITYVHAPENDTHNASKSAFSCGSNDQNTVFSFVVACIIHDCICFLVSVFGHAITRQCTFSGWARISCTCSGQTIGLIILSICCSAESCNAIRSVCVFVYVKSARLICSRFDSCSFHSICVVSSGIKQKNKNNKSILTMSV